MTKSIPIISVLVAVAACESTETTTLSSREHGQALFADPATSGANENVYSCATCHVADGVSPNGNILPGAPLAGVTKRPSFWGGTESDLLRAVNLCRTSFMLAPAPWTADDPDAQAIWEYLSSLPETQVTSVPFTVVRSAIDLAPGNAEAGRGLYERACAGCHGAAQTGAGQSTPRAVALPGSALANLGAARRVAFIERIRQGAFLGKTGTMPPFSTEVLSDADVANILAFLGI
jgi:thiosulfate dehydrogenase